MRATVGWLELSLMTRYPVAEYRSQDHMIGVQTPTLA
jgi:hypothetical protein